MTTLIKWDKRDYAAYGNVCDTSGDWSQKYWVGQSDNESVLIADVKFHIGTSLWRHLDIPVESIEAGIQLCEMWEATGAY